MKKLLFCISVLSLGFIVNGAEAPTLKRFVSSELHQKKPVKEISRALQEKIKDGTLRYDDLESLLFADIADGGSLKTAMVLLGAGLDPNARQNDEPCMTLLMQASLWCHRGDNRQIAQLLIRHNADPNAQDDTGRTPLMRAAEDSDSTLMINILLYAGALPNLQDSKGKTALSIAEFIGAKAEAIDTLKKAMEKQEN